MKQTKTLYFLAFFLLHATYCFKAQDLSLKITSTQKEDLKTIGKIEYQKTHKDTSSIFNEIKTISESLKEIGYFTNTIDSISKKNNHYTAYLTLNTKIKQAVIKIEKTTSSILKDFNITGDSIFISIENLKPSLLKISDVLDTNGKSFSKIQLKNIQIKKDVLYADLDIHPSKKRIINKIIVKGYEGFPKSFLKNYYTIKKNTLFNQKKINDISNATKDLEFIKEIKPPEVLFTKDSTLIYMYLKKVQNNSFDGIINFASDEEGKVLFNGNLDLTLNNVLNTGEKFGLFWNSIGNERQEFKINTEIPYIFNSRFSAGVSFSIYKQDSTFLNTKFDTKLSYNINTRIKIAATYNSESSEKLEALTNDNTESFNNYFFGFQFNYNIPKNDIFNNDKFSFDINPAFGARKLENNTTNQIKIQSSVSYIWEINSRNNFYIRTKTGYLQSSNYFTNELFRIGGIKSLRGFNEQSIFSERYIYFNTEYRLITNNKSYLYSITDYGNIDKSNYISLGLGYRFMKNKSFIDISSALGNKNTKFNLSNIQLNVNWINFF